MNIITGYRAEPHITAQQDRDINIGTFGRLSNAPYLLQVGQMLNAEIINANEIRIRDGVCIVQGCAASIDYGTYDAVEISNGAQGMKRIDIIAIQYEKDPDTSIETMSLVVVEGTPDASTPIAPTLTSGSIQAGDNIVQVPLYEVNIDGITIDSVTPKYTKLLNQANTNISDSTIEKWADITGTTGALTSQQNYLANFINKYEPSNYNLTDVGTVYAEANIVKFHDLALNPNRYPVSGFLVIADAVGLTTTGSSMWICRQSSSGTTDTKDVMLASVGTIYPTIARTSTSASAYLKWSGTRTAGMRYFVYRLY